MNVLMESAVTKCFIGAGRVETRERENGEPLATVHYCTVTYTTQKKMLMYPFPCKLPLNTSNPLVLRRVSLEKH